jgi:hypothetical protein
MPQPWLRVTATWNGEALEVVSAQPVSWRWAEEVKAPGPVPTFEEEAHDRSKNLPRHQVIPKVKMRYT